MKQVAAIMSLILLLLGGNSTVTAQKSTGTPMATLDEAIVMTIEVDAPVETTFGFIRATIAPGGSLSFAAGSAPAVRYVERGSLRLGGQVEAVTIVAPSAATLDATPAGDRTIEGGMAFIVGAGGAVELRNDTSAPATILELLSAFDSLVTGEVDVSHLVLARRAYTLPVDGATLTLSQHTLEAGEQFDWPADPAVTTLYPLERSDAFLITGKGLNRGTHSIALYALTIAPA